MFGKNCLEYDREKDIIGEIRKTGRPEKAVKKVEPAAKDIE